MGEGYKKSPVVMAGLSSYINVACDIKIKLYRFKFAHIHNALLPP